MSLTFDNWMGILGLLVGVGGIYVGVRSDQKMKTALEAKRQVEQKFMRYMAAQEFRKLASDGIAIRRALRNSEWDSVADLAGKAGPTLLEARGARSRLLLPLERDSLDAVVTDIQVFNALLPMPGENISNERVQEMMLRCQGLVDTASELAGRLGVESISEQGDLK